MWPWRRSLLARMFLAMLGALTMIVCALVALMVIAFRVPGVFPGESALRLADFVGRSVADAWGAPDAVQRATATLSERLDMDVLVVDLRGRTVAVASREPRIACPRAFRDAAHRRQFLGGPDFRAGHLYVVGAPVVVGGAARAVVVARMRNVGPMQRPVRTWLVLSLGWLLTLVTSVVLARTITRPLQRLTRTAERFGDGDLRARVGLSDPDEIGRLARSFDAMADRIEAMRRAERELHAAVSHELRTPLARIRVTLGLVRADDEDTRRRLADADQELEGLHHLVSDLLLQSRLDLGALTLRRSWFQVKELARKSCERLRPLWPARRFEVDVDEDLFVHVDEALLLRVLDNLLENACKYDTSGAPIVVVGRERGDAVELVVRDHGPGIAPEERERLLRPFERGRHEGSRVEGAGLGLALSRRLVEAHGGTLRIAQGEGAGARVEVVLPRVRADDDAG